SSATSARPAGPSTGSWWSSAGPAAGTRACRAGCASGADPGGLARQGKPPDPRRAGSAAAAGRTQCAGRGRLLLLRPFAPASPVLFAERTMKSTCLLPCLLLLAASLGAQSYTLSGEGCNGGPVASCIVQNDVNPQLRIQSLPNEYAYAVVNTT